MRWTYRWLDPFRFIVTDNDKLVFGCPTEEEARHLAHHLCRMDLEREQVELAGNNLHDLAYRAIVGLHMARHAGARKPTFNECQVGLCQEWHAIHACTRPESSEPPTGDTNAPKEND